MCLGERVLERYDEERRREKGRVNPGDKGRERGRVHIGHLNLNEMSNSCL